MKTVTGRANHISILLSSINTKQAEASRVTAEQFQFYLVLLIHFQSTLQACQTIISILLSSINTYHFPANPTLVFQFQFYLVLLIQSFRDGSEAAQDNFNST